MLGGGSGEVGTPWVRRCDGAPEGTYRLAGINARCRLYRYEPDGSDRFAPHYDEVWPGSKLLLKECGVENLSSEPPVLQYDGWTYGEREEDGWAWSPGDRVSHLSLLLYLSDGFDGGETVLLPEDGGEVSVAPVAGDALCFGQSFSLGRPDVVPSENALLHEGRPCFPRTRVGEPLGADRANGGFGAGAPPKQRSRAARRKEKKGLGKSRPQNFQTPSAGKGAVPKYVLRSDILYYLPPPE